MWAHGKCEFVHHIQAAYQSRFVWRALGARRAELHAKVSKTVEVELHRHQHANLTVKNMHFCNMSMSMAPRIVRPGEAVKKSAASAASPHGFSSRD